jgi:hypothetical protein
MRWAGHVERIGEKRKEYRILVRKLKERDHLEEICVDRKDNSEMYFR